MTDRYVYDLSEGSAEMKPLLGGKLSLIHI